MKKILLACSLATMFGYASTTLNYTQADRIKDMQTMAHAMGEIQNGFFYNNLDMIKEGGVKLVDALERVEPPLEEKEEKDVMTRFMNNKVKMTDSIKRKVRKKVTHMIQTFQDGRPESALQDFKKITESCMKCHTQLRNW